MTAADLPNIYFESIGDKELNGIHVPTEVKGRITLVISSQKVSPKLVQQLTDVDIAPGCSQVETRSAPAVSNIRVKAAL